MWEVQPWYISGVHTGYRTIRWTSNGRYDVGKGFVGNCYVPGSFEAALADAQADAVQRNRAMFREVA